MDSLLILYWLRSPVSNLFGLGQRPCLRQALLVLAPNLAICMIVESFFWYTESELYMRTLYGLWLCVLFNCSIMPVDFGSSIGVSGRRMELATAVLRLGEVGAREPLERLASKEPMTDPRWPTVPTHWACRPESARDYRMRGQWTRTGADVTELV